MKFQVILFFIFFQFILQAQNYSIKGKIIDFHDGNSLENAEISLKINNQIIKKRTDFNGEFILKEIPKGNYILEIFHENCEKITKNISVPLTDYLIIKLEHHEQELEQIQTLYTKNISKSSIQKNLSALEINKFNHLSLGELLQNISGVNSISTGNSVIKPMIDGVHSSRLSIINQGVRMQDAEWGDEHAPALSLNAVNKISVIKGASTLQFSSDAIGGIIYIDKTSKALKDTLIGEISSNYQTNSKGYSFAGNIQKAFKNSWNILIDLDFIKSGDYSAPNYNLSNTGFEQKAFSTTIFKKNYQSTLEFYYSYLNNKTAFLRASHVGSIRDLAYAIESEIPWYIEDFTYSINSPSQKMEHHLLKFLYSKRFSNLGKLDLQYSYQNNHRKEFDIRRAGRSELAVLDLMLNSNQLTVDFTFDSKTNTKIKTGIFGSYLDNYSNPKTEVRPLIPSYQQYGTGFYGFISHQISQKWSIEFASRFEYLKYLARKEYSLNLWNQRNYDEDFGKYIVDTDLINSRIFVKPKLNFIKFSNSIGTTFQVNENTKFIGNLNFLMRSPNVSELFSEGIHHSSAQYQVGNLRLKNEKFLKINSSYNQKINFLKGLNFNLDTFISLNYDYIFAEPIGFLNAFPLVEFKQIDAIFTGFNFDFNLDIIKNISIVNKLSYLYGKNTTKNIALINVPPFKTIQSIEYKNTRWENFYIKFNYEYVSKQNHFPIYNPTITYLENNQIITKTIDLSTPPEDFSLIHLDSGIKFKLKNSEISTGIYIQNLFNKSYRNYTNILRYYADESGRNIIFRLNYSF